MSGNDCVIIFDATPADSEQSPSAAMIAEKKLRTACVLRLIPVGGKVQPQVEGI